MKALLRTMRSHCENWAMYIILVLIFYPAVMVLAGIERVRKSDKDIVRIAHQEMLELLKTAWPPKRLLDF